MTWTKDRPPSPGEMEFHLPSDAGIRKHDDAWLRERAERLARKHQHM